MAAFLGVVNAFWIAAIIFARLEGYVAWGWWRTGATALAPFAIIALGCLWAHLYDEANTISSTPK